MKLLLLIILLLGLTVQTDTVFNKKTGYLVVYNNGVLIDSVQWKERMKQVGSIKDDKVRLQEYEKIYKIIKRDTK